jgi:Xaa-Pro aminopeptidase
MTTTESYPAPNATAATREVALRKAQDSAHQLFQRITDEGLVRPGVTEVQLSKEIKTLAAAQLGVERYWHKRVVRAGRNTLHPYDDNPPVRTLEADDIVFIDLGPIFAEWESDFGRTFVLGDDPVKLKMKADVEAGWYACKQFFDATPECTGAQLHAFATEQATSRGWEFGGAIAGHLLGEFPHEKLDDDEIECYVLPANTAPMRSIDPYGRPRHWICEIHFVDRVREIGGFFEQLLTID